MDREKHPSATPAFAYAGIFEAIPLPATLIDAQGIIVDINQAFVDYAQYLGLEVSRENRVGRTLWECARTEEGRERIREFVRALFARGEPLSLRQCYPRDDGRKFWVDLHARALRDEAGGLRGAIILREDATREVLRERRRRVVSRIKDEVRAMSAGEQVERVMLAVREGLEELEIPFDYCGVNLVAVEGARGVHFHSMDRDGRWISHDNQEEGSRIVRLIWSQGRTAYRRDLARDDPFGERERLWTRLARPVHSVVDVPFARGTLAISSVSPHAFTSEEIGILEEMAQVLADGFARMEDFQRLERQNRELQKEVAERWRVEAELRRAQEDGRVHLALERVRNEVLQMESEADWARVAMSVRRELSALVDFEGCGVNIVDLENECFFTYDVTEEGTWKGHLCDFLPRSLRQAMETGEPVYRGNRAAMEALGDNVGPGRDSVVDVPFLGGTLGLNAVAAEAFGARDLEILRQFAPVMSAAYRRVQDLAKMAEQEEQLRQAQKMEAVGQLAAGMAHNFNNQLMDVLINVQLALRGQGEMRALLREAEASARRAADIVDQLLLFARPESRREFRPLEVGGLLGEALRLARKTFDPRIQVEENVAAGLPRVQGAESQLVQVFLNLLLNARDALREGAVDRPHIGIEAGCREIGPGEVGREGARSGTYIVVRVRDNGTGMDEATRLRIFEPFFTTKKTGQGTGLGLATAYATLCEHGGWINCESARGRGTCFSVLLPAASEVFEERQEEDGELPRGSETLLLIEDEEVMRRGLKMGLEAFGYRVLEAGSGEEGLSLFRREGAGVELVILDLSMPGLSGHQVMEQLHSLEPQLKVVVSTGYAVERVQDLGARALLKKPYALEEALETVRQVLDA